MRTLFENAQGHDLRGAMEEIERLERGLRRPPADQAILSEEEFLFRLVQCGAEVTDTLVPTPQQVLHRDVVLKMGTFGAKRRGVRLSGRLEYAKGRLTSVE